MQDWPQWPQRWLVAGDRRVRDSARPSRRRRQADRRRAGEVKGKVSFQTWALKPKFTDYVQGVIDGFEKKYPGVQVEWLDQPGDGLLREGAEPGGGRQPARRHEPAARLRAPAGQAGLLLDVATADPKITEEYVAGGLDAYRYPGHRRRLRLPVVPQHRRRTTGTPSCSPRTASTRRNCRPTLDELIEQARTFKEKAGGKVFLMSRRPELSDLTNAGVQVMSAGRQELHLQHARGRRPARQVSCRLQGGPAAPRRADRHLRGQLQAVHPGERGVDHRRRQPDHEPGR